MTTLQLRLDALLSSVAGSHEESGLDCRKECAAVLQYARVGTGAESMVYARRQRTQRYARRKKEGVVY